MSGETLSQSDIDTLLRRGGRPTPRASAVVPSTPAPQLYDFGRPNRVSAERLRALVALYERLVRSLEGWLLGRLRGQVELRLHSVEPTTFGDFALSLPTPCASFLFDIADSGGLQGVVDIGHPFAYYVVDRLFGGGGQPAVPERPLTVVERMAVRGVAERILVLLREAWQDHVALELSLSGFETVPEILQAAPREDTVLVANIEARAGTHTSLLLICLPFAVLDKFFSGAYERRATIAGSAREREMSRELSELTVSESRVTVSARLPGFRLPLQTLAELRPGRVVTTGVPRDARLEVHLNGQLRFAATAGRVGQRVAVRVEGPAGEPPATPAPFQSDDPR